MGQALYRKYRSKSLKEVVGQEHITKTLENALKQSEISHAYLFTGPKGVGKTSVARILAHEVNGFAYDDQTTHLDIIEIDAASNRRIDEIRDLRDKIHTAPTSGKYKVYIIDEIHMLTKEAFNALLKTLEEPPAHVIFILATTEAHRLPETIVSRTQRFSFKPIDKISIINHLREIAKKEQIDIDVEAISLIADHGEGSFRDSISLLDQARSADKHVSVDTIQRLLGIAPTEIINKLLASIQSGKPKQLITLLSELREQGLQANQLAKQLAMVIRGAIIHNEPLPGNNAIQLLRELLDVPTASQSDRLLEIILLEQLFANMASDTTDGTAARPEVPGENNIIKIEARKSPPVPGQEQPGGPIKVAKSTLSEKQWQNVLGLVKKQHNTLYGIIRMGVPIFNKGTITLRFRFPFHQKRISETKNQQIITDIIKQETGLAITLNCVVDKNITTPEISNNSEYTNASTDAISNIFGGAEVLDS